MALQAPNPIDVQDFQFKLHCRLKVFENESTDSFQQSCSLVSVASRFGLVFVGSVKSSFKVLQISAIEKHILKESSLTDYSCRIINLPSSPKYLEVNCDSTKLAVVVQKDSCPVGLIYDVASFLRINVMQPIEIRLSSTPNVNVTQCGWNPAIPNNFTVCKDDGTLSNYELLGNGIDINELPKEAQVTCMCWSPKGKQIAVGSRYGTITQYKPDKPDLKAMRIISAPPLEGSPAIISLQWISTYQFIGVYQPQNGQGSASVITVEAPKTGNTVYTNYEDICYSNGASRPPQFYMIFQPSWNTLMVASSNSMEVGVLGINNEQWTQWFLSDAARAELPLSAKKQETMPVGLAFDTAAVDSIVWGETSLPPAPFLLLLSHHGLLCCFRVINMKDSIQSICSPPETFPDTSGLGQFIDMSRVQATLQKQVLPNPATVSPAVTQNVPPLAAFTNAPPLSAFQVQSTPPKTEPQTLKFNLQPPIQQTQPERFQAALPTFSSNLQSEKQPQNVVPNQQTVLQIPKPQFSVTPRTEPVSQLVTKPSPVVSVTPAAKLEPKIELPPPYVSPSTDSISQEETNIIISKTIREECEALEIELMNLIQMGNTLKTDIGNDVEASDLVNRTDELLDFLNEITETNEEQSTEVFSLKQGLIQTWAWYEDARARFAYAQSETLKTLLNIQNLDPVSLRYSNDIKKMTYYIQSQLSQASRVLDEQWENFQDACKNLVRLKIPTMEAIYQTMVRQSAIYQKQKYILKDISNRIRSSRSKVSGPSLLLSLNNADNLEVELLRLQLEPESWLQAQYNRVVDNQKKLTSTKVTKLGNFLLNRKITEVTVNKPQLCNASLQSKLQSHLSRSKSTIEPSILGAGFSPITSHKPIEPRAVNFNQSTDAQAKLFTNSTPVVSATTLKPFSQPIQSESQSKNTFTPVRPSTGGVTLFPSSKPTFEAVAQESNKDYMFPVSKAPPITASFPSFAQTTSASQFSFNLTTKAPVTSAVTSKPPVSAGLDSTNTVSVTPTPVTTKPPTSSFMFASPPSNLFDIKSPAISTPNSSFSFAFTPNAITTVTPTQKQASNVVSSTTNIFNLGNAANSSPVTETSLPTTFKPSIFSFKQSVESVLTSQSSAPPTNTSSIFSGPVSTSSENTPKDSHFAEIPSTIKSSGTFKLPVPPLVSITPVGRTTTIVTTAQSQPSLFSSTAQSQPSMFGGTSSGSATSNASIFAAASEKSSTAFKFAFSNTTVTTVPSSKSEPSTTSSLVASVSPAVFGNITNTVGSPQSSLIITPVYTATSSSITTTTSSIIVPSSQGKVSVPSTSSNLLFGPTASIFGTAALKLGASGVTITPSAQITTSATVIPTAAVSAFNSSTSNVTSPSLASPATTPIVLNLSKTAPQTNLTFAPLPTTSTVSTAVPAFSASTTSFFGQPSNNSLPFSSAQTTSSAAPAPFSIAQITTPQFGASQTPSNTSYTTPPTTVPLPFAAAPPAQQTTVGSPFATPPTSVGSLFGGTQKATAAPFGTSSTFAPTTTASAFSSFGTAAPTSFGTAAPTSTGSLFSSKPAFQSGSSLFNTTATPTTNTAFGGGTTFGGGASVFGATTSTASNSTSSFSFAAAANIPNNSAFGGQTQPQSQFTFVDAAKKAEPGSFGFGNLNVQPTSTPGSFTGLAQPANVNPFAKATQEKPTFGGGSLFAKSAPTSSSSSMFGNTNTNSTFGGASGGNSLFGSPAGFGSTAPQPFGQQQSSFGQQQSSFGGGGTFGSPSQAGAFSTGNQSVGQTGFGAFSQAPKAAGFGSAPIFGGSPGGFGAPATFGGAPAFGSGSAFGGATSAFGDTNAAAPGAFNAGPPQQENSTFANLANQNTLGFGSLAQQSQTNPSMSSFSGSPSFSTWR